MPATLPAPIRQAAARSTLTFDWLVPQKPYLKVREVAAATGMGETFVEDYFKASEKYHGYNGAGGKRESMRIPRAFVIELLVSSAQYDAETKLDAVLTCLRELSAEELHRVADTATSLARQR